MDGEPEGDEMKVFKPVSVDRNRQKMPDTNVYGTFDARRLNRMAPLSKKDRLSLAFDSIPTEHAQEVMKRRIALAQAMKYGG